MKRETCSYFFFPFETREAWVLLILFVEMDSRAQKARVNWSNEMREEKKVETRPSCKKKKTFDSGKRVRFFHYRDRGFNVSYQIPQNHLIAILIDTLRGKIPQDQEWARLGGSGEMTEDEKEKVEGVLNCLATREMVVRRKPAMDRRLWNWRQIKSCQPVLGEAFQALFRCQRIEEEELEKDTSSSSPGYVFRRLSLQRSRIPEAGLGVFAVDPLEEGLEAEYWGRYRPGDLDTQGNSYTWQMLRPNPQEAGTTVGRNEEDHHACDLDASHPARASWTRWVNCPLTPSQINLDMQQRWWRVFYKVTRPIAAGEELLIDYGPSYRQRTLHIPPWPHESDLRDPQETEKEETEMNSCSGTGEILSP